MTSLPKRGDRVRVTNVGGLAKFSVGDEHILQMDAKQHHDDWIYFDFVRVGERFPEFSGAVKVEILERAEPDKLDGFTPEQCQAFAVEEQAGFARGMRRAVQLAKVHVRWDPESAVLGPDFAELEAAVDLELKNG